MLKIHEADERDTIATAKEVLEFLTRQMRREEKEQVVSSKKEKIIGFDEDGKKIHREYQEPVVIEIKTRNTDALKASEMLAKHFTLLSSTDSNENEIKKVDEILNEIKGIADVSD